MNKLEYYENEWSKSKKFINNITDSLEKIRTDISDLEVFKSKTDNIIDNFQIKCFYYNLINEMIESEKRLNMSVNDILKEVKSDNIKNNMELSYSIKKVNYINDILDNSKTQLELINKEDLKQIENLQINAIKKGIYDKFMLIKSDIDRDIIKSKFDKMKDKKGIRKSTSEIFCNRR